MVFGALLTAGTVAVVSVGAWLYLHGTRRAVRYTTDDEKRLKRSRMVYDDFNEDRLMDENFDALDLQYLVLSLNNYLRHKKLIDENENWAIAAKENIESINSFIDLSGNSQLEEIDKAWNKCIEMIKHVPNKDDSGHNKIVAVYCYCVAAFFASRLMTTVSDEICSQFLLSCYNDFVEYFINHGSENLKIMKMLLCLSLNILSHLNLECKHLTSEIVDYYFNFLTSGAFKVLKSPVYTFCTYCDLGQSYTFLYNFEMAVKLFSCVESLVSRLTCSPKNCLHIISYHVFFYRALFGLSKNSQNVADVSKYDFSQNRLDFLMDRLFGKLDQIISKHGQAGTVSTILHYHRLNISSINNSNLWLQISRYQLDLANKYPDQFSQVEKCQILFLLAINYYHSRQIPAALKHATEGYLMLGTLKFDMLPIAKVQYLILLAWIYCFLAQAESGDKKTSYLEEALDYLLSVSQSKNFSSPIVQNKINIVKSQLNENQIRRIYDNFSNGANPHFTSEEMSRYEARHHLSLPEDQSSPTNTEIEFYGLNRKMLEHPQNNATLEENNGKKILSSDSVDQCDTSPHGVECSNLELISDLDFANCLWGVDFVRGFGRLPLHI